ncbi:MAG: chemotaxis protein CheD [Candidatus Margulisiibacteriota bacterium]|nr:MAG: chemotaxis protein CheD [Candidatus Margulisiibacteriota bacterium]HAR62422.1 chemotaxis protein CheD [Candidatus Margulisiibacteriota bacterium]HCT84391.1 chemotaxis protein CheD [Candidatus Margulisiibacteriota bacterium]HCY37206.1 chemotaxis protein CheD [Candidatus Margulisiibacteriota bacterium]
MVISVGLGEVHVSKDPSVVLAAHGLGSCIGLLAYDPIHKIGGLAHILLPDSTIIKVCDNKGKFADTAIPYLIELMKGQGAIQINLMIKIAGGAQMFAVPGMNSKMNIGEKNIIAVKRALSQVNLKIKAEEVGGHTGRTVKLFVKDGTSLIRTAGLNEKVF